MRIQIMFIAGILFLLNSCKNDFKESVSLPDQIDLKAAISQGELDALLDLLKNPSEGLIRMAHYTYTPENKKYHINGSFNASLSISQVMLNETSLDMSQRNAFYHDSGLLAAGLQNTEALPDYFGGYLAFKLFSGNEVFLQDEVDIPAKLEVNTGASQATPNPECFPGYTLQWNAAPGNELGLYVIFEFDPAGNTHLPEPAFSNNRRLWYRHLSETGSYTLTTDDFPHNLPDGSVIFMRAIRPTFKDYATTRGNFRLVAHSEVHCMFRYRAI